MHYSRYKVKPHHKLESGRAYLNPGHTHFLLVDDGTKRICKGTEEFRVELMHKISSTKEEEGNSFIIQTKQFLNPLRGQQ